MFVSSSNRERGGESRVKNERKKERKKYKVGNLYVSKVR